jgi:hypothetical protein
VQCHCVLRLEASGSVGEGQKTRGNKGCESTHSVVVIAAAAFAAVTVASDT